MSFDQITTYFDASLHDRGEAMLREYLQHEILKFIFEGKYAHKYTFLGGTCLRIAYGTERFSEDLDFDNVGLTQSEFEETAAVVKKELELRGFEVGIKFAYKGAFHCRVRFPRLLHIYGLNPHKEARMLIKLDTEKQHYEYERQIIALDCFGIQTDMRVVPLELLGSQKVAAILGRKRAKGRDFYDIHHVLNHTRLDYGYLKKHLKINNAEELRMRVMTHIEHFDFSLLADDVSNFLLNPDERVIVENFLAYWQSVPL